jgi:hypothetical protein
MLLVDESCKIADEDAAKQKMVPLGWLSGNKRTGGPGFSVRREQPHLPHRISSLTDAPLSVGSLDPRSRF